MAKPKERTLTGRKRCHPSERFQLGIVSEIISEWWAISFRNRGRFKIGMVGDFARNQHSRGKNIGEVAETLDISYKTVANSTSRLKQKLGAHSHSDLIRIAVELSLT